MPRAIYRSFVAIGLATVLIGAVTSCGSSTGKTLSIWYSTDDPVERGWSGQLASLYSRSHPGVKVSLTPYAFEDINLKMQLALSSGHPPDLAYVTPRTCGIPVYVSNHRLLNLTPYAKKYGWATRLRPGMLQDYNSPFGLYATQKRGLPGKKVPVFGVPDAVAAVAIMYNAKLLHRLRIAVPRTFHDFAQDVSRAKTAGYTPIALGNGDGWLGDDWYQTLVNTLYPYSQLEKELRLDPSFRFQRPGFSSMAAVLQSWAENGYFTPNFGGLDAQDGVDSFFQGKTLFEMISSSENSQILSEQKQTGIPIGIFPFPTPNGRAVIPQSGYEGWIVPRGAADKTDAIRFINWVLKPSTTKFLIKQGVLPAARVDPAEAASPWQKAYLEDLDSSRPGVFLDAAPVPNLNATMEANVQLLMPAPHKPPIELPTFLPQAMQTVYSSHGARHGRIQQIDCEF